MVELTPTAALPPQLGGDVLAMSVRAAAHDGVKPFSEQTVLDIRRLPEEVPHEERDQERHLLVLDEPGEINARLLGYAHIEPGDPPSVEIVVDPDHRRQGIGSSLARQVLRRWPDARFWAHGNLPAARAMAASLGLVAVRELWQMSRPLSGEWSEIPEPVLPDGFEVRTFQVGVDEQAWLEVNSRAFVNHAEQGRMTLADLQDRIREPWFDPNGFILIEDRREVADGGHPRLAAFHWTKIEPAEPGHSRPTSGEVYVVGVDPDYQGKGLGKAVTILGLRHLKAHGLDVAMLYTDADNTAAVTTYHRLGFERSAVDVMYAAPA
jgi:mycothiol synthase